MALVVKGGGGGGCCGHVVSAMVGARVGGRVPLGVIFDMIDS